MYISKGTGVSFVLNALKREHTKNSPCSSLRVSMLLSVDANDSK